MPIYEYEHDGVPCHLGKVFEVQQSIHDDAATVCPDCEGTIHRIISHTNVNTPKGNAELRDLGFSKLVKRDDGIYENVTARKGESKIMERGKSETMPDFSKIIKD